MKKLNILFVFAMLFFATTTTLIAQETTKKVVETQKKTEVAEADLPEAIKKTLKESFADYKVEKAHKTAGDTPNYYIKLKKENETKKVVIDHTGKVLE